MASPATITARPFTIEVEERHVPGLTWAPTEPTSARPLVLVGHGGGGSKETVVPLAEPLVRGVGAVVLAIDGPVHGDRRSDGASHDLVLEDFRALWRDGTPRIDEMVADWSGALEHVLGSEDVDRSRMAWCGLSAGTGYGVSVVAAHPELAVAVLGMWGLSYPSSERLAADAPNVKCPLVFHRKADDALFTVEGQEELFALFGSPDKRLVVYPGPHGTTPAQIDDIVEFLSSRLNP